LVRVTQVPGDTHITCVHSCAVSHVTDGTTPWYVSSLWAELVLGTDVPNDVVNRGWDVGSVVTVVTGVTVI